MSLPSLGEALQQNNLFAGKTGFVSFSVAWEGLTLRIMGLSGKSAVEESKPEAEITWPSSRLIRTRERRARAKASPAYPPLSSPEPQKHQNLGAEAGRAPPDIDMSPFCFHSKRKRGRTVMFFLCCFLTHPMVLEFFLNFLPTLWPLQPLWGRLDSKPPRLRLLSSWRCRLLPGFKTKESNIMSDIWWEWKPWE